MEDLLGRCSLDVVGNVTLVDVSRALCLNWCEDGMFYPHFLEAVFCIEMLRTDRLTSLPSLHRTPDKL